MNSKNLGKFLSLMYTKISPKIYEVTEVCENGQITRYSFFDGKEERWTNPLCIEKKGAIFVNQNMDRELESFKKEEFYEGKDKCLENMIRRVVSEEEIKKIAGIKPEHSEIILPKKYDKFMNGRKEEFFEKLYLRRLEDYFDSKDELQTPFHDDLSQKNLITPTPKFVVLKYGKKTDNFASFYNLELEFDEKKITGERWGEKPILLGTMKVFDKKTVINYYIGNSNGKFVASNEYEIKEAGKIVTKMTDSITFAEIPFKDKEVSKCDLVALSGGKKGNVLSYAVDKDKDGLAEYCFCYKVSDKKVDDILMLNGDKYGWVNLKTQELMIKKDDLLIKIPLSEIEMQKKPLMVIKKDGTVLLRIHNQENYSSKFFLDAKGREKFF